MKQKSIKKNAVIYSIRSITNLLLPLITFPYVCRVLSVDALGKVNFAGSIVSYFLLLAGLGISSHGRVQGAKIRDDREKFSSFASELVAINLVMSAISCVLLLIYTYFSEKALEYRALLLISGLSIWLTFLGQEWIFDVYEEYTYITVRSILVQILSVLFLFIFVKDDGDLYWYAIYSLLISSGSNLLNFVRLRKMVRIRIRMSRKLAVHLGPIVVLFANTLASSIYLNSDVTILGYLASDAEVGYYHAAVKVYNLLKMALASITAVSGTRLAYLCAREDKQEYYRTFRKLLYTLLMLAIPATIGTTLLREPIVLVIAGEKYLYSSEILSILMMAMLLGLVAGFICGNYTLIHGQAKRMLFATVQGAIVNIVLNFMLIGKYGALAAAFTTVIAEGLVLINLIIPARKDKELFQYRELTMNLVQFIIASAVMGGVCCYVRTWTSNMVLQIITVAAVGVAVYFSMLLLMRNKIVMQEAHTIMCKIKCIRNMENHSNN